MIWRIKKLSTRRGLAEPSKLLLGGLILVFTWISKYIGYPSNNQTFMPSIGSLCVGSFYLFNFLTYNHTPEKWRFPALESLLLPQFATYRHRTGFIVKRKQMRISNYLGLPINFFLLFKIFKVAYFAPKNYALFKKFPKNYCSLFFQKEIIGHMY